MKREELTALQVPEESIDKIMELNNRDLEKFQKEAETSKAELGTLQEQLQEANKTIEGFQTMDVDRIKKTAEEWKGKAEQAAQDAEKKISEIQFQYAMEKALTQAKARNTTAVKALLEPDALKLTESGEILGLKEQLDAIKTKNDFLFESDGKTPAFAQPTSGNPAQPITREDLKNMGYQERMALKKEDPDTYHALKE